MHFGDNGRDAYDKVSLSPYCYAFILLVIVVHVVIVYNPFILLSQKCRECSKAHSYINHSCNFFQQYEFRSGIPNMLQDHASPESPVVCFEVA